MYNRRFTPERIQNLEKNEIFVFGSNLAGMHGGGAARIAVNHFGAIWGQGVGLQGQCYAIPTMQGGVETIQPYVDEFIEYAKQHTELTFFVTRIGCGIAGFIDSDIAPLFKEALKIGNIILPKSFVDCLIKHSVVDAIRGSLMAGAAGDALGYEVEFMSRRGILSRYGNNGITKFELDSSGKALISDDTQMTLFTANGILMGVTRGAMRGIGGAPEGYVRGAYLDWYYTQTGRMQPHSFKYTWLRDLPQMAHNRAPGNTCLSALGAIFRNLEVNNNSKGCGGIMRVAPMGLFFSALASRNCHPYTLERIAEAGGVVAECTHKHPLGVLPASQLTVLLYKVALMSVEQVKVNLDRIVTETLDILNYIYVGLYDAEKMYLRELSEKAIILAHSDISDVEAISQLGEGWVAEETWAIALFCAIRHIDSVEDAIIASVNHDGDSDSTGSVCGNIMGAIYGYEHIKHRNIFCPEGRDLEDSLELSEIILALADDLSTGCIIGEGYPIDTPEKQQWYDRYCEMKPTGIHSQSSL